MSQQFPQMISQTLPKQINYRSVIPKGYPSVYKQWDLDPLTNNKQWANNDIVRFNFQNIGGGVFDPYRSYIQITVSTNDKDHPIGLLQIDSSAQSFINQSVLYSKNRQIERITEYSVLAAYLNDIGLTQYICQGRDSQGFGYGSFDTMPFQKSQFNNGGVLRSTKSDQQGNLTTYQTVGSGLVFPTIGNTFPAQVSNSTDTLITNAAYMVKGHLTNANPVLFGNQKNGLATDDLVMETAMNWHGFANNMRGQYVANFISQKFPESTSSIPNYEVQVDRSVSNTTFPFYFNPQIPYNVQIRTSMTTNLPPSGATTTHVVNCSNFGFSSLFSPFYTKGTFQPFISSTVPQTSINNGMIQSTKFPIYRRKFKVPLISGVMGVLIQKQQFLLIPLRAINDCLLELTLDPYAMFTSGYNDVSQLDNVGCLIQQKRNYQIQRIKYKLQTYHFIDDDINFLLQTSMTKQIIITSPFWQLANQYQIPGGTPVNNNYIVGLNTTHLNQIICLFVSNDYQTYSFARKHFRLSNNVKRFWSKIGVQYWPPQPYKGNGGNPSSNVEDDDNSNFVENIYWSNGFMFAKTPLPRINAYNFSVNERPYDVTNKNTFYDVSMFNNPSYQFNAKSVNADTGLGMSWIHENRVVGKAAYVISYTPFCNDDFILQGINLSGINNFQVLFQQDSQTTYPRDQTLYIYGKSSVVVKYGRNGIQTFGR